MGHAKKFMLDAGEGFLLVIDVQTKLYATMESGCRDLLSLKVNILIELAKAVGMPIVVSEQYPSGLGKTIEELSTHLDGIPRHDKIYFSCFRDAEIKNVIEATSKQTAIVCGIETHVCVLETCLDLIEGGYRVFVASDATCSRHEHDKLVSLDTLRHAGAVIYPTETIAFMILEKAGTPVFKSISPLFKQDINR